MFWMLALALALAQSPTLEPHVLDFGQGERFSLRSAPEVGQVEKIRIVTTPEISIVIDGEDQGFRGVPGTDITYRVEVLSADGREIVYRFDVEKVKVGRGDLTKAEHKLIEEAQRDLIGLHAVVTANNRRQVTDVKLESDHPGAGEVGRGVRAALRQFASPLPAMPVGTGAKWTLQHQTEFDHSTIEFSAEEITPQGLRFHREMRETLESLDTPPALPPGFGQDAEATSYESLMVGDVVWPSDRLFPRSGLSVVASELRAEWVQDGRVVEGVLTTRVTTKLKSK